MDFVRCWFAVNDDKTEQMYKTFSKSGHSAAQHSVIATLVYMIAVDELICRPVTRDCMEAEQRPFVPTVTMKLLWYDFCLPC